MTISIAIRQRIRQRANEDSLYNRCYNFTDAMDPKTQTIVPL